MRTSCMNFVSFFPGVTDHSYHNESDSIVIHGEHESLIGLTKKISKLEWPADHWRFGGKLPGDEGWEEKRDYE